MAPTLAAPPLFIPPFNLAHALGMEVVTEGVEDTTTLAALIAGGCDLAQGYLFSHLVPAPETSPKPSSGHARSQSDSVSD